VLPVDAPAVAPGSGAGEIAAAIVARINAEMWLLVEAEAGLGGAFFVRATVLGSWGNAITVSIESEALGVSVGSGAESRGAQAANIEAALKKLVHVRYNYIVSDFSEQANIVALAGEITDRFTALRQIGGRAFVAVTGDKEATVNNPHICLVPRGESPQLPGEWAARWCAAACRVLADDPAANTNGLGVLGLSSETSYDLESRQALLTAGITTYRTDAMGGRARRAACDDLHGKRRRRPRHELP